jgi:hypothetical protein
MNTQKKAAIITGLFFLCLSASFAQQKDSMPGYLVEQLRKYTEKIPREEIYIHTDRDEFIAGEDLWLAIYLFDRQSLKLSDNSRMAYVELLNAENHPVLQKKFPLDQGSGPGHFVLPDTLSTGIYTLRAYTSWMKNPPFNCFLKPISVYNAFTTKTLHKQEDTDSFPLREAKRPNRYGVTLEVNNARRDTLEMLVKMDNSTPISNSGLFYLLIQTRGNINQVSTVPMRGLNTGIAVPKGLLSQGINQITLFNAAGNPVAETYIYTPVHEDAFNALQVTDSCRPREKIALEFGPGDAFAVGNATHLSVSVTPAGQGPETPDISDYLILGTEYGEWCRSILRGRRFGELDRETTDSLLTRLQSNWIDWSVILSGIPEIKYPAEKEDHFLWGKLQTNEQPAGEGEIVILCFPGKVAGFQYARTDREGNFRFAIPVSDSLRDLIIMPENISANQITVESPFSNLYPPAGKQVPSDLQKIPPYVSKWSVNHQVQAIYGTDAGMNSTGSSFPVPSAVRFYGKPDIELRMADYINLPLMEEVFFELLPNVSLKKKNTGYEITITERVDNKLYVTNPCLMIDGVIIHDPSLIISLDPETVEQIDVIKEQYLVGSYSFPGLVNVITRAGDFTGVSLPGYMQRFTYRVLDPVAVFVSPEYSTEAMKSSRIPDYRNTLYWNPSVKPDQNGGFKISLWSGDNKGAYQVTLQGVTGDGRAFTRKRSVQVK